MKKKKQISIKFDNNLEEEKSENTKKKIKNENTHCKSP